MKPKKTRVFIESSSISEEKPSGIGFTVANTIRSLSLIKSFNTNYELTLLVDRNSSKKLNQWKFNNNVKVKDIPIQRHLLQILLKYNLLPPMDLFIGKGIYIFPNYKNWPLLFSKSATYIYDAAFVLHPETIQPRNLKMLNKNIKKWIKRSTKIITISKTSKNELVSNLKIEESKIDVIYCGVDKKKYNISNKKLSGKIKQKYSIKNKYILFVGNIEPRKNITNLLMAFSELPKNLLKKYSLLLIGGGGWLNETIYQKINALQREGISIVKPNEYLPEKEMPNIYANASLLVSPSIHEGFDLPTLQAMASGVPVLVSDIDAHREIVGKDGAYFDPYLVTDIKKQLLAALKTEYNSKDLNEIVDTKTKKFNWNNSAIELFKCIESIK